MAVFLSTNTSTECVRLQGGIASKPDELGNCSLGRRESFGMVEENRRRRIRRKRRRGRGDPKEEDMVVSRTGDTDAMVSEASNSAHSCNGMAKEDMGFSQSDIKGPHSGTEMPQEDMVSSPPGANDPHLCHIKGPYSNREMCREVMASSQDANDAHWHHVKGPHLCNEMSEEDTVPSPSASNDIPVSGGTGNGPSCSTGGSQLCKEREKDGVFSEEDGRGITHSEGANPYSKMQQSGTDDVVDIESAPSHGIGSPHPDCERRKHKDMVSESGLEKSYSYAIEGLHPHSEMQQRCSDDAMIVENEHWLMTGSPHSAHQTRKQKDMVSESGLEKSYSYAIEGLHPHSEMQQRCSDDAMIVGNEHWLMTGSPHSAHQTRKQKDMVSESGIGITHADGTKGSNPNSIELPHVSPEKILKRPGKLLPCPRCESLDTKFCYFNNYNVNQPRHFCRKCQRYWTAGGSLRNLPVGAGRRKNKHVVSSHQKHPKPSDIHTHVSKGGSAERANGSLSSFSASPSSQSHGSPTTIGSICSMVDLVSKQSSLSVDAMANLSTTGVYQGVLSEQSSCQGGSGTNGESSSLTGNLKNASVTKHSTCSATDSSTINPRHFFMGKELAKQYMAAELQHPDSGMVTEQTAATAKEAADAKSDDNPRPTVGALPFPYIGPWQFMEPSSACANVPPVMWGGFPWPFIPTMWGPFGNAWNIQWNLSTPFFSSGGSAMASSLAMMPMPQCGIEETAHPESDGISEPPQSLWVPKTLRIGDPVEAARSSIWSTLGLDDSPGLLDSGKGSISAAFQCKKIGNNKDADGGDGNDDESKKHPLHTNPAALSRSVMFNEKS